MLLQFLLDIPHQQQAIAIRRLELLKETCGPLCRLLDIGGEMTITDGADLLRRDSPQRACPDRFRTHDLQRS